MTRFAGFSAADFGGIAGTTWRGPQALGGLLAAQLRLERALPYDSWAVRRRPELHLALRDKHNAWYDFDEPTRFAKLFVYTHEHLAFGLYFEASADPHEAARYAHWYRFRERLRKDTTTVRAFLDVVRDLGLTVGDYYRTAAQGGDLGGRFAHRDGRLQWQPLRPVPGAWQDVADEDLVAQLAELPRREWLDLHVYKEVEQRSAVSMGADGVDALLTVLRSLAPLYELAADAAAPAARTTTPATPPRPNGPTTTAADRPALRRPYARTDAQGRRVIEWR